MITLAPRDSSCFSVGRDDRTLCSSIKAPNATCSALTSMRTKIRFPRSFSSGNSLMIILSINASPDQRWHDQCCTGSVFNSVEFGEWLALIGQNEQFRFHAVRVSRDNFGGLALGRCLICRDETKLS